MKINNKTGIRNFVFMAIFFILIVLFVIMIYHKYAYDTEYKTIERGDVVLTINQDLLDNSNNDDSYSSSASVSLCEIYTDYYPTYFMVKEVECGLAGGNFVCQDDKIGCYDIGAWNSSLCTSGEPQVQTLKASCLSLESDWTCTATQISCEVR